MAALLLWLPSLGMSAAVPSPMAQDGYPAVATGAWQVGQKVGTCLGMRSFVAGGRKYTLTLRPQMTGPDYYIGYVDEKAPLAIGEAEFEIAAAGSFSIRGKGTFAPSMDQPGLGLSVQVSRAAVTTIANAAEISIMARGKTVVFAVPVLSPAVAALQRCRADQLESWGVDKANLGVIATPPTIDPSTPRFFGWDAYPPEARRRGQQGRVVMLLTISTAGKATNCRLLESSGSTALDNTSCTIALTRARFSPAKAKTGETIVGLTVLPINWALGSRR